MVDNSMTGDNNISMPAELGVAEEVSEVGTLEINSVVYETDEDDEDEDLRWCHSPLRATEAATLAQIAKPSTAQHPPQTKTMTKMEHTTSTATSSNTKRLAKKSKQSHPPQADRLEQPQPPQLRRSRRVPQAEPHYASSEEPWKRRRTISEDLGDKAWVEDLQCNGWKVNQTKLGDHVFFATRCLKDAVEGVTKITTYAELGRRYRQDGNTSDLILQRARDAIRHHSRGTSGKTTTTAAATPSAGVATVAAAATVATLASNNRARRDQRQPQKSTRVPSSSSSSSQARASPSTDHDTNASSNNDTTHNRVTEDIAAVAPVTPLPPPQTTTTATAAAATTTTTPAASATTTTITAATGYHNPKTIVERLAALEISVMGNKDASSTSSSLSLKDRIETLERFLMGNTSSQISFLCRLDRLEQQCGVIIDLVES